MKPLTNPCEECELQETKDCLDDNPICIKLESWFWRKQERKAIVEWLRERAKEEANLYTRTGYGYDRYESSNRADMREKLLIRLANELEQSIGG